MKAMRAGVGLLSPGPARWYRCAPEPEPVESMSNPLDDFIVVTDVDEADAAVAELFLRKFRARVPEFPHHIVAWVRREDGGRAPGCYTHVTDCGDLLLGGGACTDDRVLRRMSAHQRSVLRAGGGIYRHTIEWVADQFSAMFPALFVYVGDALSERVLRASGFVATRHERLYIRWLQAVPEHRQRQLVAKAFSFIPF